MTDLKNIMKNHLFKFNYEYDKEQLKKEFAIMSESIDTELHTVNSELLYRVANNRNDIDPDIFPKYHDLKDKERWDNINSWTIRAFSGGNDYNTYELFQQCCPEMKRISEELTKVVGSAGGNLMVPYFLLQEQDTEVPVHIDMGFKCAINLIVDGSNTPIYFRDEDGTVTEYNYDNALLNVCGVFHGVPEQQDTRRIILKFRIVDVPYEVARERMVEYFGDSQT
jgi:hypothetical protein